MKRKKVTVFLALSLLLLLGITMTANAAKSYNVSLTFINTSRLSPIAVDSVSTSGVVYARNYITSNTASYNCLFRLYNNGGYNSGNYWDLTTPPGQYRRMDYTVSPSSGTNVGLYGRPNSDEGTTTINIVGSFGAG